MLLVLVVTSFRFLPDLAKFCFSLEDKLTPDNIKRSLLQSALDEWQFHCVRIFYVNFLVHASSVALHYFKATKTLTG